MSRSLTRALCAFGVLAASLIAVPALAFPANVLKVPNPIFAENSLGEQAACITCHNNPDGGDGCPDDPQNTRCFNPFGQAFLDNEQLWDSTLAGGDADGDGFTNGQELQDFFGTWLTATPYPGVPENVTPPGDALSSPGGVDADSDGFCPVGEDLDGDGSCLDVGENSGPFDCDDNNAGANSEQMELCTNLFDDDCNGLATAEDPICVDVIDADGDGFCILGHDDNDDGDCLDDGEMGDPVDCNDEQITAFPGANENCVDGIDNDCDEDVDDQDSACTGEADVDDDGFCPIGRDVNDDGDCLDTELDEQLFDGDCNDMDPNINPEATELCLDGLDNDCDGIADLRDIIDCGAIADNDGDGFCPTGRDLNDDGNCASAGETDGDGPFDCEDFDATINAGATEICTDAIDQDCDGEPALTDPDCADFLDSDNDGYCGVGQDLNDDGDCDEIDEIGLQSDCDDTNANVNPVTIEDCFDGLDNECDGSTDANDNDCADFADTDHDGVCISGRDNNGDGDCTDTDEQTSDVDLAPTDPTIYPGAPEHCTDMKDNDQDGVVDGDDPDCQTELDADGDGYCPLGIDRNGDGDCMDADEDDNFPDCDDGDATVFPGAEELCMDFRDNDCDRNVDLDDLDSCGQFLDVDGDGFCGVGIDDTGDGDCFDLGEDRFGIDCNDNDPTISPRAREVCDDEQDNDCDGLVDAADGNCSCQSATDCPAAAECMRAVCLRGDCSEVPDPLCNQGGGCGVVPANVATEDSDSGSGPGPGALFLLALLGAAALRRRTSSLMLFLAIGLAANSASAYPSFGPGGLPVGFTDSPCQTCHVADGGGSECATADVNSPAYNRAPCLNPFGAAYRNSGGFANISSLDADGDDASGFVFRNNNDEVNLTGSARAPGMPIGAQSVSCSMENCAFAASATINFQYGSYVSCNNNVRCRAFHNSAEEYTFQYSCRPGTYHNESSSPTLSSSSWDCVDENECADDPCNGGTCTQDALNGWAAPGYSCSNCPTGYILNGSATTCVLNDDCAAGVDDCDSGATCQNVAGAGNFNCICPNGETGDGHGVNGCVNPNECSPDPCGAQGTGCTQTPTGPGWSAPGYSCTCAVNYGFDGVTCVLTNECTATPAPCHPLASCNDPTPSQDNGDVQCACPSGYSGSGFGAAGCTDIDECSDSRLNNCSANATCMNTAGSFTCTCIPGTTGNGVTCTDINECGARPCGQGDCEALPLGSRWEEPGYRCDCATGYQFDGTTCIVRDECLARVDDCVSLASCSDPTSALGDFTCSCPSGYDGDGVETSAGGSGCADVDECGEFPAPCDPNATCTNEVPGFTCDCNTGYLGNGLSCVNADECSGEGDGNDCSPFANCVDTDGSFTCTCRDGFQGTGTSCIDEDECLANNPCTSNQVCVNLLGQEPRCDCLEGFTFDGSGDCVRACGDSVRGVGEACDDGNEIAGDGCDACHVEPGWACFEDGTGLSACSNTCGDGITDYPQEECDEGDGNDDTAPDACRTTCVQASCGDGVQDGAESCDEGANNSPTAPDACRPDCRPAYCGDGIVDTGETCDPGTGVELAEGSCVGGCFADAGPASRGGSSCVVAPAPPASPQSWPFPAVCVVAIGLLWFRQRRR